MRMHLKKIDWHLYGLNETDFAYTLRIVKVMLNTRMRVLAEEERRIRRE